MLAKSGKGGKRKKEKRAKRGKGEEEIQKPDKIWEPPGNYQQMSVGKHAATTIKNEKGKNTKNSGEPLATVCPEM